jgi:LacI family transcriptional regulator
MTTRVTMADVAAKAGVSSTAVSLVLNNRIGTRLSQDVVTRVRAAAVDLGYRPNLTARALSTRRSQVLGFVSQFVTTGRFGSDLIRGALLEAQRHGQVLFIAETVGEPDASREAVEALVDRQVDGIIFAATVPEPISIPPHPSETPVVLLNAVAPGNSIAVLPDDYEGGLSIVTLLLEAGHTTDVVLIGEELSHIENDSLAVAVRRRLSGIKAALDSHRVRPVAEVACQPWSLQTGFEAMTEVLARGIRPRALICLNDRLAFGAYRALAAAGLRIPDDVSVVSFDDDDIALYLDPPLTTAAFPYEEMGALAVRLLLTHNPDQKEYLIHMPIHLRGSVKLDGEMPRIFGPDSAH